MPYVSQCVYGTDIRLDRDLVMTKLMVTGFDVRDAYTENLAVRESKMGCVCELMYHGSLLSLVDRWMPKKVSHLSPLPARLLEHYTMLCSQIAFSLSNVNDSKTPTHRGA